MPSGKDILAAIIRAAIWGTPVACGADSGILLKGDSLKGKPNSYTDDSLGQPFARERDLGEIEAGGSFDTYLRYDGLDLLFALLIGATGGVPTQPDNVNDPNTYQQVFTLANNIKGLFATMAINKEVNVFEYPSVKILGLTMKGTMGKPVDVSWEALINDEVYTSATNDLTSFANVTYFEEANRVLMSQGTFRLNNSEGAALGAGDVIKVSDFEWSFKRKESGEYVTGNNNLIDEPDAEGMPEVRLKLGFPRYTETTHLLNLRSDQRMKCDIEFLGDIIDVAFNRQFKISLPNLGLVNAEALTSTGKVEHPLEFEAMAIDTAPAGMDGITKPFQVDVTNRQSADVLA